MIDAVSGIGKKYVPSSVYCVSFRNICSRWVVATWPLILVSILMDLTGRTFGSGCGIGLGRQGRTSHMIGTITPWANAVADAKVTEKARHARIAIPLNLIFYL